MILKAASSLPYMQQPNTIQAPLPKVILAFAIVYIVWGSTYFFIQAAERNFTPFMLGALRFSISGFLLLGWCALKKEKLFYLPQLKSCFIAGNLLLFIGTGSIIWAELMLPSSFVAVLVSASPLWFVLLDTRNYSINFNNSKIIIGIITGFAGILLLFGQKLLLNMHSANSSALALNLIIIIIGNISWCAGSLYTKYHAAGNTIVSSAWQMIFAALSFFTVACFNGEAARFTIHADIHSWLSVIYLVIMGSLVGYSAYVWLLEVRPATQVSTNAYVNPVVAVLLGALFGGEMITAVQIVALAIILGSVFIINLDKYKRKQSVELS